MRIYAMTATFGKLEQQTLMLKPGLHVIHAPNEWGKSTWCAFLTAMLYGLDTRSHSTKNTLSDKERYTPWSGSPMTGRIDLHWNGRDITIERKAKGRTPFGDFRAYETGSGLPVPELTAQNCGALLLGVERSVFTRSAMIRQTDLPVTRDEALRSRLNALVTTGDDTGTVEELERKLKELRNRCRYNRTGLIPQAEAELSQVSEALASIDRLETQYQKLQARRSTVAENLASLENHLATLNYRSAAQNAALLQEAEAQIRSLREELTALDAQCASHPSPEAVQDRLQALRSLQSQWTSISLEEADHQPPMEHPIFRSLDPENAMAQTREDIDAYRKHRKLRLPLLIFSLFLTAAGFATAFLAADHPIPGFMTAAAGMLGLLIWAVATGLGFSRAHRLACRYGSRETGAWLHAAEDYVDLYRSRRRTEEDRRNALASLRAHSLQLCGSRTIEDVLAQWEGVQAQLVAAESIRQKLRHWEEVCKTLRALPATPPPPSAPDTLTLSPEQTHRAMTEAASELQQLQLRLGQCQGQLEALGHRSVLEARRHSLDCRIRQLEETWSAANLALETLQAAKDILQRRFAPRITARAQEILSRLTDGRYQRLVLDSELSLQASANDETGLHSALWRSDGTADLLYLALRLAVAEALVPEGPLILDDALIRLDDTRLKRVMDLLREESRQVLLFTCHSRESQYV